MEREAEGEAWAEAVPAAFFRVTWGCQMCGSEIVREGDESGGFREIQHDCSTGDWDLTD